MQQRNLIIIAVALVLALGLYYIFAGGDTATGVPEVPATAEDEPVGDAPATEPPADGAPAAD